MKCQLVMFSDASFAGDLIDSATTSGGLIFLMSPNTWVRLGHMVKKEGAVSNSPAEAETIALDACLRVDATPALTSWEQVLDMLATKSKRNKRINESNLKAKPLSTL